MKKEFHTDIVKQSIMIKASKKQVWSKISNIASMPMWAVNVKDTIILTKKKKGVGAIRLVIFENSDVIEEHIVAWKDKESFTYVATSGLPLRAYVATISVKQNTKYTKLTWESYLNSQEMTSKEFSDFVEFINSFYHTSLERFKLLF